MQQSGTATTTLTSGLLPAPAVSTGMASFMGRRRPGGEVGIPGAEGGEGRGN